MRPTIFIHTNARQWLGAQVAAHALRRNATRPEQFDVRFIRVEEHHFVSERDGQEFRRYGARRIWNSEDLQSFTPLRFMAPELMRWQGRALVIDPDVFAVGDVGELLARDMGGKAVLARPRGGLKGLAGGYASSVMLLDCAKLTHWRCAEQFAALFEDGHDYGAWIDLKYEDRATLGALERVWNDFDRLAPDTRLLHNTRRWTQPWKTGLPIDFVAAESLPLLPPYRWAMAAHRRVLGGRGMPRRYLRHPDRNQELLFFALLAECLENGVVSEAMLRDEMARDHLRHDALELLAHARAVAA